MVKKNSTPLERALQFLEFDTILNIKNVHILNKGEGIFVLEGNVENYTQKLLIEKFVKRIRGVTKVINDTQVVLPPSAKREDAQIVKDILYTLQCSNFTSDKKLKIEVAVVEGAVELKGKVNYCIEKILAEQFIGNIRGIVSINNTLSIKNDITSESIKNLIIEEFILSAGIEASTLDIEYSDGIVTLKGKVSSVDKKKKAEEIIKFIPYIIKVNNFLSVH